jgi:cyclase
MRRLVVLGGLVLAGSVTVTVAARQPPPAPKVVEVEKLRDNLFVLKGGGGNTAVFVTSSGVTVVDTKNPGWGQPILDKIKELTNKPVTRIVNTHTHGDHVSGNVEFPAGVEIVTQESTKANMDRMATPTGFTPPPNPTNIFKENNGKGMPTRTFKDKMTLDAGADQIDLYYFGRGHTNGDAWVVFPSLRAMHAGDVFSGKNIPLLDANNGGSGVAIPDTLANAASTITNVDSIITGHGGVMTMADLKEYAEFNREFLEAAREAKKAGKSVDEFAASWKMPAKYAGYAAPAAPRLKANIQVIFDEIK